MQRMWAVFSFAVLLAGAAEAQTRLIKGTVADVVTGDPVAGAAVKITGTALSATTAADGSFSIADAPAAAVAVSVTSSGYRVATADLPESQSELKIGLQREMAEEIVVTGRASRTERRHLAVSIATVQGDELNDVPAQTVEQALQGKVAGANIQRNDGAPGARHPAAARALNWPPSSTAASGRQPART